MRSSWQIDLKWAAGLLACVAVVAAGALFSLTHITSRDTAEPLSTARIAIGISERVTDEEYAAVQAAATANPEANVSLTPIAIVVKGSEITGLTKDQAARLFASRLAAILYEKGSGYTETLIVTPPPESDKKAISLGPAGALSADMHSDLNTYFFIAGIVSIVFLGLVAGMSRGAGRIGAPAFVVVVGALSLAALWAFAAQAIGDGDPSDNPAILAAREAARNAAGDLRSIFLIVVVAGFATAVASLIGGIAFAVFQRGRSPTIAAPATAPAFAGKSQPLVESEPAS